VSPVLSIQRLRPAAVLIGLIAALTAALLPVAAVARAPQAHHLEFRLAGPDHQDIVGESAILIRVRCLGEPCTVVATAKSKDPSLRTGKTSAHLAAGDAETLALPLARRGRGKLKAALAAGRSPTFTVEATAHDQAGSQVPLSIEVQARKP